MNDTTSAVGGAAPDPGRRQPGHRRLRRSGPLALAVIVGCCAGGRQRYQATDGLTPAKQDQVAVRLGYGVPGYQEGYCAPDSASGVGFQVPIVNDGPGPVQIRSVSIDPPGAAAEPEQRLSVTIGAGKSASVAIAVPSALCQSPVPDCGAGVETDLYATFAVTPMSDRVHDVRLPVGAWTSNGLLQQYEGADFDTWDSFGSCDPPGVG